MPDNGDFVNQFFAFAKTDNSFIVSADTREALLDKIAAIRSEHPAFYAAHVAPGYYIAEAGSLREAKFGTRQLTFDLPLFRSPVCSYAVYLPDESADGDDTPLRVTDTLAEALAAIPDDGHPRGRIVVTDAAGDRLTTMEAGEIYRLKRRQAHEERRQLSLFDRTKPSDT